MGAQLSPALFSLKPLNTFSIEPPLLISDIAAGHISMKYGFKGINYGVVSACATSNHAFGDAFKMIQSNLADVIITGGAEAAITEMSIAGFSNMKALSKNNNHKKASRPFDANRDGFVIAEGAGILVLEELEHALERNVNIIGEIVGYGASADAYHLTSPDENGYGAIKSMKNAIKDAILDGTIKNEKEDALAFIISKAKELNLTPVQ